MKLDEVIAGLPLSSRINIKLDFWWTKFRMKIGWCSHDCSFGKLGDKIHLCMCGKEVENEDWEIERKCLNKKK